MKRKSKNVTYYSNFEIDILHYLKLKIILIGKML